MAKGQIKVTARAFDTNVTRNSVTLPFTFIPAGRQPENTPEDKPIAGFLGVSLGQGQTNKDILTQLASFFASDKSLAKGADCIVADFNTLVIETLNTLYAKPAWEAAVSKIEPWTITEEKEGEKTRKVKSHTLITSETQQKEIVESFLRNLAKEINPSRIKSSVQIRQELEEANAGFKDSVKNITALCSLLKVKTLADLEKQTLDKAQQDQLALYKTLKAGIELIKIELKEADEREAQAKAKTDIDAEELARLEAELLG